MTVDPTGYMVHSNTDTPHKSTITLNCLSVELLSTALSFISGNYAMNIHSILYNYAMHVIMQHIHIAMQITRVSSLLCFKSPVSLLVKPSSSAVNSLFTTLALIYQGWGRQVPHQKFDRSEEHTSELQSLAYLVCRLLLEKKKNIKYKMCTTM